MTLSGLLVMVRGSRRHWTVVEDNGDTLLLAWDGVKRAANREDLLQQCDPLDGRGWVPVAKEVTA